MISPYNRDAECVPGARGSADDRLGPPLIIDFELTDGWIYRLTCSP